MAAARPARGGDAAAPQVVAADLVRVEEVMSHGAVTVPDTLGLEALVELLLAQGLSRAPVVDGDGRLVGVVGKTDLVVAHHVDADTEVREVSQAGAGGPGRHVHEVGALVRDVMSPAPLALPVGTTLGDAARRLLAEQLHAAPVVAADGAVVGVLSATDVVAWVAGAAPPPG